MTTRTGRRGRATTVAAAALLTLALTSCGSEGDSGDDSEAAVLSRDELKSATLTLEDIGTTYVQDPESDDSDDDENGLGCLGEIDEPIGTDDAEAEVQVSYKSDNDFGIPAVTSGAATYTTVKDLEDNLDALRDGLEDCDKVKETDSDGATTELEITTDDERSNSDLDEQFNVYAEGTIASDGLDFPFAFSIHAMRVDNNLAFVSYVDMVEELKTGPVSDYAETAAQRLIDVVAGDPPTQGATSGSDDAEEEVVEGAGFEPEPFDGGSYTWDSGVTMKTTVERVERWGDTDDFCGDGSCGVANPDDTRFVIKYEVTVPDSAREPFDPYSCPGELHVENGNDEDAFSGVMGDFDRSLSGSIMPGSTKFGVAEYYIEKDYVDEKFYMESTCGSGEDSYEMAFFSGNISKTN